MHSEPQSFWGPRPILLAATRHNMSIDLNYIRNAYLNSKTKWKLYILECVCVGGGGMIMKYGATLQLVCATGGEIVPTPVSLILSISYNAYTKRHI